MNTAEKFLRAQFKALGTARVPQTISVDGKSFGFREEIKHSFAVAVAVYESPGETVVVKFHRQTPFFCMPLGWIGKLMAAYENAVLKYCEQVPGVPEQRKTELETAVAHDYIAGRSLRPDDSVDNVFFERMLRFLDQIHERGIAYVDLEKPENILKGEDGYPYFIDFQVAFYWPEHVPLGNSSLIKFIRRCLQRCDTYHAYKHMRRMRPDMLSESQYSFAMRKPWPVKIANAFLAPWQLLRKITKR